MLLLEIIRNEDAARVTDLETHWTTYIAAEDDEFLKDSWDEIDGLITIIACKKDLHKVRILAAFPKNNTIIINS